MTEQHPQKPPQILLEAARSQFLTERLQTRLDALNKRVLELEAALATARDDALEEGAARLWLAAEHARRKLGAVTDEQGRGSVDARCWSAILTHLLIERDAIRALKGKQP